ncbi:MAG: M1 family aminopeptidase [Candidatus Obscuribacterales bacterium]
MAQWAFATWMATKACDYLRPDWHEWDHFAADRARALESDSLMSTRPIHFNVDNPLQALEMFERDHLHEGCVDSQDMLELDLSAKTHSRLVFRTTLKRTSSIMPPPKICGTPSVRLRS